jgi:hypothetical protein
MASCILDIRNAQVALARQGAAQGTLRDSRNTLSMAKRLKGPVPGQ